MEKVKTHKQGFRSDPYPMYQTDKINVLERDMEGGIIKATGNMTLVNDSEINIGDKLEIRPHGLAGDLIVTEVLEQRKPKGKHKDGCIFYSISYSFN